jgi:UDP-3-O-[3-hydroxymyristoyl] N-acetylglucosamine deacetylase/3-hydroxyacyl-[acyl-carrier-protein] dehydratase
VDQEWIKPHSGRMPAMETTLRGPVQVTGPGTFLGKAQRTLHLEPTERSGWWFDRTDIPDSMPIHVAVSNVWTTVRNIVLCSGSPHNYMRMVEHIIALRRGMGIDNLAIRLDSGDPPLFDRSSMDLVEAVESAGIVETGTPASCCTVTEPVAVGGLNGSFLAMFPAADGDPSLLLDCAVDFKSAIGRQRIRFTVDSETFRHGAEARTNTTLWMMLCCKSIGKIFADTRNLGYTMRNILIAGPKRYVNRPRLIHNGKSLEAAWHRATLDLLAAISMINQGRFAGRVVSYKAGHDLDVRMIRELYEQKLLRPLRFSRPS